MDKTLQTALEIIDIEIDAWGNMDDASQRNTGPSFAVNALKEVRARIVHALQNPPPVNDFDTDFEWDAKRKNWFRKDATPEQRDAIMRRDSDSEVAT